MSSALESVVDLTRRRVTKGVSAAFALASTPIVGTALTISSQEAHGDMVSETSGAQSKMDASQLVRVVSVEHHALQCARPFEAVHKALVESVPTLKPELGEMLVPGDREKVATARRDWPKLWLFLVRDHGALTAADGKTSKAMQYEIGNPLTAERMTRHVLGAGLYAPLRVLLYEDESGKAIFEYDLPSSLFGQFGDQRVAEVGRELDAELESVLQAASGARGSGK